MTRNRQLPQLLIGALAWVLLGRITSVALMDSTEMRDEPPALRSNAILAAGRGRPWINLRDGVELVSAHSGATGLEHLLEQGLVQPVALASADFDEDGVPDLVSGYVGPRGGLLTLHRGNIETLWPQRSRGAGEQGGRGAKRQGSKGATSSPTPPRPRSLAPFLPEARIFEVREPPDFLGTGDFDADGYWDIVAARRGGQALRFLSGDGRGRFAQSRSIEVAGRITALVVGEINRRDGLDDVIVGIAGPDGPHVLIFEGPNGALSVGASVSGRPQVAAGDVNAGGHRGPPRQASVPQWEAIRLPTEATALALGQLDDSYEMDLAVAAGGELLIVHGRDRRLSLDETRQAEVEPAEIEAQSVEFTITSLALGDFIWDREHRTDIALLGDDGQAHLLSSEGDEDDAGGHRGPPRQEVATASVGATVSGRPPSGGRLIPAKLSSFPTDDLMVINQANHQLHIISDLRPNQSAIRDPKSEILSADGVPVAVLPMRLNADALNDLVILREGSSAPTVMLTAAAMTFTVNDSGNGSDATPGDGVCATTTAVCTLRAAIQEANANMGADTIDFSVGSGTKTISPTSALPTITDPVTIDGTTQPGFAGSPIIELNGAGAFGADGLKITAGSSTVRGLVINRCFVADGIEIGTTGNNIIEGNFIGTSVAGTADLGSSQKGVRIVGAPNNLVGGTTAAARNVISGNNEDGVLISGSAATGNLVQGNYIGTDVTGTLDVGNSRNGVLIDVAALNNTIGGASTGAGNLSAGNNSAGVRINAGTTSGNLVQGNYIGTDFDGDADLGNSFEGVLISGGPSNTIGGTTAAARNIISGNDRHGVDIDGSTAMGNLVQGNYIGTTVTGATGLGNTLDGVIMLNAPGNTIGGTASGARNIISGNKIHGVDIFSSSSTGNLVQGNYIGTDVTGTLDLGNLRDGVAVSVGANGSTIGGTTAAARNLISGNDEDGVHILQSSSTLVQGNYIGTNLTGTTAVGNSFAGVFIANATGNTIGGTTASERNVISGNKLHGVDIASSNATANLIQGNFIGTQVNGASPLGNTNHGVHIFLSASNNTIGGTNPGTSNTIAFNGNDGVNAESGTSNRILGNSIHSNTGLGIDLGSAGVTANDAGDGDTGPNNLQNFPALSLISSNNGTTTISGMLDSTANATFRIEFFSNTACDSSGNGEGQTFIGSTSVMTNGSGIANINVALPVAVPDTRFITATATDPSNNTSEFSQCAGSITIIKDAVPNNAQDFSFSGPLGDFSLDDDTDATLPNQLTFMTLAPGSYTVTEGALAGWSLTSLACTDPDSGSTVSLGTRTATIDLDVGEMITCTFTNTKLGTITIIKDAVPNDPQDVEFSRSFGANFFLDDDSDGTLPTTATFANLLPGSYTVTEAAVFGWTLTNLVCNDPDHQTTASLGTRTATIDLDAGETVTCTFTNVKATGFVLQDERNGNCLSLNLDARTYTFKTASNGTFTGTGTVTRLENNLFFRAGVAQAVPTGSTAR